MASKTRRAVLCAWFNHNNHHRSPAHPAAEAIQRKMHTYSRRTRRPKPVFAQLKLNSAVRMEIHPALKPKPAHMPHPAASLETPAAGSYSRRHFKRGMDPTNSTIAIMRPIRIGRTKTIGAHPNWSSRSSLSIAFGAASSIAVPCESQRAWTEACDAGGGLGPETWGTTESGG